jgi:alkanesulfonate monooxygenase SsuD/methylene tetrahydromethanopterin reductase-like flavin-dependent oxidoreductase (luciferase family)
MFAEAGYPDARDGVVSDALLEELVLYGNEEKVSQGIRRFLDAGVDEVIVSLLPAGRDLDASLDRTFRLLAQGV